MISDDQASNVTLPSIEGITFSTEPGKIYVPLDEAIERLGLEAEYHEEQREVRLREHTFSYKDLRSLTDGTKLITLTDLSISGTTIDRNEDGKPIVLKHRSKWLEVLVGDKRTEVSLGEQRLRAWQGARLVLACRISSGRNDRTPSGKFRAGPYKARRHYSSLYRNAPMPWSVQVTGHVFIHGFTSVPNYPASHGCIRVPLNEGNPAKFFYEWIDKGTPVTITKE